MYVEKCYRNRFKIASKGRVVLMVSAMVCSLSVVGHAAPSGGVVTTGSATIASSGTTTNINQSTQKASINWQGFSIASNETVNFNQPSASSITLNRVVGNETSVIAGALNANGKVFLLNSNGILFTQGSSVNTSGLVASTLNLSDEDFNNNNFVFQGNGSQGSVINMGTINIANSGYAALLGKEVSNQGVIVATKGVVALSSGDKITLNFNGDSLMSVTIDEGTLNALVENKNAIYADGGKVILTAKAANDLLASQVNNEGLIQAQTLDDLKGEITLYAHGGTTTVSGKLDASAPTSGDGGFIETSGDKVKINDSAKILTKATNGKNGTWLIDPVDFTIAASGGDMSGTFLSNYLNTQGSQTIASTTGSINVNDAISWDAANTLTLNALNDINVNKTITGKYTAYDSSNPTTKAGLTLIAGHDININNAISLTNAALSMTYGNAYTIRTKASYSGTTTDANGNLVAQTDTSGGVYGSVTFNGGLNSGDALTINDNSYTLIYSMSELSNITYAITGTYTGHYALSENLDASDTTYSNSVILTFAGTLTGLGHSISNLTITAPSTGIVGLIGKTISGQAATIQDLGLINVNITADSNVGALLGYSYGKLLVSQVYATGVISGSTNVGGLIGGIGATPSTATSTITSSYSDVGITAKNGNVGGLVGSIKNTTITNSHASGNVIGATSGRADDIMINLYSSVGGLVGQANANTIINDSYATGDVMARYATNVGGLIGYLYTPTSSSSVFNSYASGDVTGWSNVGGLIGVAKGSTSYPITIQGSAASGDVTVVYSAPDGTSGQYAGGLIGDAEYVNISNSHATGNVSFLTAGSGSFIGGLIGYQNGGSLTNSYATGKVIAGNSMWKGGLLGYGNGTTVNNNYWNADLNNKGIGNSLQTTNTNGLTGDQVADAKYYADGTITQVLANRATAAAAKAAAAQAAAEEAARLAAEKAALDEHVANANQQTNTLRKNEESLPPLAAENTFKQTPPSLAQNITIIDPTYTASIKTIVIDGKTYVIEDDEEDKK